MMGAANALITGHNKRVVWTPLTGSQALSLSCPAHMILYHGTRGPGKTDAQLMRFRRRVGQGYGKFWRGIIFDREYKNLDDLISKSTRWFYEFGDGARFLSSKSDYRWVWPTGEELYFRSIKKESDYWNYHGQEFPFIGWNELTKYPTNVLFEAMMSCNRSSFRPQDHPLIINGDLYNATGEIEIVTEKYRSAMEYLLPDIPLEVFATTNPYGAGHNWVKREFGISNATLGKIQSKRIAVFNPRTQQREVVVKTRCHLFGSYKENIYLAPEYVAELESISDPNKRKAWLQGDWDIVAGGMFDDVWDEVQHMLTPFRIPHTWQLTRSFDWGSSAPFSVGWWAISDGSDVQLANGKWRSTIKGDLFRIGEWYGYTGKSNQGLRMLANDVAAGIVDREIKMGIYGRVIPGPADNSIWDDVNGNSIAGSMAKPVKVNGKAYPGVTWRRSDKSPGSRKHGWEKCREYLAGGRQPYVKTEEKIIWLPREKPGLFAFNTCVMYKELFPVLPRDETDQDDVDTEAEDHIGDEVRYMILSRATGAKGGKTKGGR